MNNLPFLIEDSLTGLMTGGIYALIGVGIVLVFRATQVFNFAHGAVVMFGAYFYYSINLGLDAMGLGSWSVYVIALPATLILASLFGMLLERLLMRPMLGQNVFAMIMVTIGLISVLDGLAALIWKTDARYPPELAKLNIVDLGGILINTQMVWSFCIALVVFVIIVILFQKSRAGIAMRATATDQSTAYAMGINVPAVFASAWVVAAATGALAGILLAPVNSLTPGLSTIGLSVIAVVILGGVDSVIGVFVAGLIVGWLEAATNHYFGGEAKDLVPYIVVLAIILIRPHGLFGTADINRV
ncbi:MAG: branched-chain amino acid ABC transporter permease [Pseudomonadota bacterium]